MFASYSSFNVPPKKNSRVLRLFDSFALFPEDKSALASLASSPARGMLLLLFWYHFSIIEIKAHSANTHPPPPPRPSLSLPAWSAGAVGDNADFWWSWLRPDTRNVILTRARNSHLRRADIKINPPPPPSSRRAGRRLTRVSASRRPFPRLRYFLSALS